MNNIGYKNPNANLESLGISHFNNAYWNLSPEELIEQSIKRGSGVLTDTGALSIRTGEFTGRAPKDRFIVKDEITKHRVDWGKINMPISPKRYAKLYKKVTTHLVGKDIFIQDVYACADERYRMNVRVIAEYPWSAQFIHNMFRNFSHEELQHFVPDWKILCAPGFQADPQLDGVPRHNFAIVNFTAKTILIGGTGYTGEMKKGIFAVLNFLLPERHNVLPMHCSVNVGGKGDAAVFFGLSGTGKTTLSADPERDLIGDDEHGWSDETLFNFEGGCYAKCINLSEEKEPDIYHAIKHGAILENVIFYPNSRIPNYEDSTITENTRVSYPLAHIDNLKEDSITSAPKNIFFLTCDAFGVLPPISKLDPAQAMYHFISGYTAKVAGTEEGITDPVATFSSCFGSPFLPLHATEYAEMLGKKMQESGAQTWLVNTGWTGGAFGKGRRIKLKYTRAMINAAMRGDLDEVEYEVLEVFNLQIPKSCPGVPSEILNPRNTWSDKIAYDGKEEDLAQRFMKNFEHFKDKASQQILEAGPKSTVGV